MSPIEEQLLSAGLAILVSLLSWWIISRLQPRAKLRVANQHQFSFDITGEHITQPFVLHTQTILIRNLGRQPATNVEISLSIEPSRLKIWPPCEYEMTKNVENISFVKIKSIVPRKDYLIETLSNVQPIDILSVTHDDGEAKFVRLRTNIDFGFAFNMTVIVAFAVGFTTIFYWLIRLAFFLYRLLPP